MSEQALPRCILRTFQKIHVETEGYEITETDRWVFCTKLDHWVSVKTCLNCRYMSKKAQTSMLLGSPIDFSYVEKGSGNSPVWKPNGLGCRVLCCFSSFENGKGDNLNEEKQIEE